MQNSSTQSNILLAGIKDGIAIMKGNQYRLILEVSAVNFDLKSEQEQNTLVFQYQSFLNSLHFPIQIVVQSKKLDLSTYLKKIGELAGKQNNELIKVQTEDYIDFVGQLINMANIMKKRFYVVVGYQPISANVGLFDKIFPKSRDSNKIRISEDDFTSYSKELRQRAQTVAQGLGSMGLHCRQLTTQEVIEMMYEIYNPDVAGKEKLSSAEEFSGSFYTQIKPGQGFPETEATNDNPQQAEVVIDNKTVVETAQKQMARYNQAVTTNTKEPAVADNPAPVNQTQASSKTENMPSDIPDQKQPAPSDTDAPQQDNQSNKNYGF